MKHRIADFFFPRICPICGRRLSLTEEGICYSCLISLPRTDYANKTKRNEIKNLFELKINVEHAISFMRYMPKERSASIVKSFKYNHAEKLAITMGRIMAEEIAATAPAIFRDIDIIIPVPISRKRRKERGYNQAEKLAEGVAEIVGKPIDYSAVIRKKFIESQTRLTPTERVENIKDAFDCIHPERLNGKHLLLIDDVITTGATVLSLADTITAKTTNVTFSILSLGITGDTRHNR